MKMKMKAKLHVFCLLLTIILVTANPILQLLQSKCPLLNYPSFPTNCNDPYEAIARRFTNDKCPNCRPCQNPPSHPYQKPQVPKLDRTIEQMLMKSVFTNPSLKAIIDPKSNVLPNECLAPRQPNSCQPNVVNNYIIIPADFLNQNETDFKFDTRNIHGDARENDFQNRRTQSQPYYKKKVIFKPKNDENNKVDTRQAIPARSNLNDVQYKYQAEMEFDPRIEERGRRTVIGQQDEEDIDENFENEEEQPKGKAQTQFSRNNKNIRVGNQRKTPQKNMKNSNHRREQENRNKERTNDRIRGTQNRRQNGMPIIETYFGEDIVDPTQTVNDLEDPPTLVIQKKPNQNNKKVVNRRRGNQHRRQNGKESIDTRFGEDNAESTDKDNLDDSPSSHVQSEQRSTQQNLNQKTNRVINRRRGNQKRKQNGIKKIDTLFNEDKPELTDTNDSDDSSTKQNQPEQKLTQHNPTESKTSETNRSQDNQNEMDTTVTNFDEENDKPTDGLNDSSIVTNLSKQRLTELNPTENNNSEINRSQDNQNGEQNEMVSRFNKNDAENDAESVDIDDFNDSTSQQNQSERRLNQQKPDNKNIITDNIQDDQDGIEKFETGFEENNDESEGTENDLPIPKIQLNHRSTLQGPTQDNTKTVDRNRGHIRKQNGRGTIKKRIKEDAVEPAVTGYNIDDSPITQIIAKPKKTSQSPIQNNKRMISRRKGNQNRRQNGMEVIETRFGDDDAKLVDTTTDLEDLPHQILKEQSSPQQSQRKNKNRVINRKRGNQNKKQNEMRLNESIPSKNTTRTKDQNIESDNQSIVQGQLAQKSKGGNIAKQIPGQSNKKISSRRRGNQNGKQTESQDTLSHLSEETTVSSDRAYVQENLKNLKDYKSTEQSPVYYNNKIHEVETSPDAVDPSDTGDILNNKIIQHLEELVPQISRENGLVGQDPKVQSFLEEKLSKLGSSEQTSFENNSFEQSSFEQNSAGQTAMIENLFKEDIVMAKSIPPSQTIIPEASDEKTEMNRETYTQESTARNKDFIRPKTKTSPTLVDKKIENPVSSEHFYLNSENRLARNSQDETFVEEVHDKFPDLPEEAIRKFLSFAKHYRPYPAKTKGNLQSTRQGQKRPAHPTYPNHPKQKKVVNQRPHDKFATRRDNGMKNRRVELRHSEKNNQASINNTLPQTNSTNSTNNIVVELTPSIMYIAPENATAHQDIEQESGTNSEENEKYSNSKEKTQLIVPELGTEDVVPIIYENGIIDEYYPLFFENGAHLTSDEFNDMRRLNDDRFHYTTDKNDNEPFIKETRTYETVQNRYDSNTKFNFNDVSDINIHNKEYFTNFEDTIPRPAQITRNPDTNTNKTHHLRKALLKFIGDTDEIEFRTPPSLEIPDFETRNIKSEDLVKSYQNEIVDETSTFSHAKFQRDLFTPSNDLTRFVDPNQKDNVVVHGRSKVIRYGFQELGNEASSTHDESIESEISTERQALVFAKSISNPEDFW